MNSWIYTIILSASFLVLFGMGELFFHKLNLKAELSRKFVHLSSGLLTLSFPLLLENHWQALFLCGSFAALLLLSKKYRFLKSINAVDRTTHGSFLFPLSVYLCFHAYLLNNDLFYFYSPMLVLAVSDPLAALFGKKWPMGKYKILKETKTIVGSSAFFISAFCIIFILMFVFDFRPQIIYIFFFALITALAATISEAISTKGFDNFFIPVTVLAILMSL